MLRKVSGSILNTSTLFKLARAFGSHAGPLPEKLQKVTDTTVKINVKNADGKWEQIHGIVGESFFEALYRGKVKGASDPTHCNGDDLIYRPHERPMSPYSDGPTCGRCRIVMLDNWYEKVSDETEGVNFDEQSLLNMYPDSRKDARLSCCVPVEAWMDGITLEVYPHPKINKVQ